MAYASVGADTANYRWLRSGEPKSSASRRVLEIEFGALPKCERTTKYILQGRLDLRFSFP